MLAQSLEQARRPFGEQGGHGGDIRVGGAPPLARLCEAIERELRAPVQANQYASWTSAEGLGVHWEDHDTVIVQLDGAKRWRIYGTTHPGPLYRDIEDSGEAPTEPVDNLVLNPSDVCTCRGACGTRSPRPGRPLASRHLRTADPHRDRHPTGRLAMR
ncbi:cupin domain-containing protein [Streptomyces sp. NPDC005329]|uniref:JmjC domain-containing protein n=1 Tax=Streptomyces sp. NPDC005329 TaxID=3157034 RepID=UPI0033A4E6A9